MRHGLQTDWLRVLALTLGGFMVTGASNAYNQIIEKITDGMMERTRNRPIPKEEITVRAALIFTTITALLGSFLLWKYLNPLSGILGLIALILYAAIYTPVKKTGSIAVFVGAFPGAVPPLLGWTASTGELSFEAWVLFAIQFIWQFPHFWALAWMLHDDYQKAGFWMLPAGDGRSKNSALQIVVYTAGLIPVGLVPYLFGIAGISSAIIATLCGIFFLSRAIRIYRNLDVREGRKLLFASIIYLPVVQIALMFDVKPLP